MKTEQIATPREINPHAAELLALPNVQTVQMEWGDGRVLTMGIDQSLCDFDMHQQCSGYDENAADRSLCDCTCHDTPQSGSDNW